MRTYSARSGALLHYMMVRARGWIGDLSGSRPSLSLQVRNTGLAHWVLV